MSTEAIDIKITAQRDVSIGEFVGRDKIVNNIEHIYERALTAVEEAAQEKSAEAAYLAAGVTAFIQSMKDRATEGSSAKRGNPYKGLLEYRLSDAQFFFGRSRAIEDLLERMGQGPLAVLHAQSGAGKSSLLQAGISSVLIANGHLPVYLRPYNVEPSLALKRAFLSDPGQAPLLATAPLRDFLRQVTGVLGPQTTLYIFLDQFEEFFTQLEEPARAEFVRELAECLEDESLNVRWLLSMRAEFFGNLANFRPRIRNPFQNDYRLRRMTRAEAQEAAEAPAARRGIHYEPGLIDQILDDLGKSAVHPPEIQLVCSALYEELKPGEMVITRAMYEAAGKAEGILSGHLERVLSRDLPPEQRPVAQRLLEALITSDNRRVLRTRAELLAELASSGIAPEALDAVLTQLIDSRLLRVQETNVEPEKSGEERDDKAYEAAPGLNRGQVTQLAYELAHDYLLGRITLDPAVQARKAAQELLAQEVYAYKRFGTLMSADKLDIVEVRRAELALTPEAEELIRKSAHKLRRQRQFVMGGLGVVIILVLFIIAAAFTAFQASQERAMAISTQQAAQTAAVESLSLQVVSEQRAEAASTQRAEAQSQQATSQALSTQALINAQTAQDSAATAAARADLANAVVETLFDNNGLVPVGAGPWDFAFDGTRLWVSNDLNDTVQAIDPATGAVQQTLPVGNRPGALAFDAQRQALWVVNQGDDLLQAIDVTSGQVIARVATANRPAALLHDGTRLWVTNYSNNTIQAVDPGSGRRIGQPLPVGNLPWAMAFDGKRVWVANRNGDSLSVIDTLLPAEAITATDVSTVSLAGTPGGLVFDGNWMWVSLQDRQEIQAFNPDTRQPVITLTVGVRPTALGFDGAYLWVANQGDNTVQAVDRVAGTVSAPIPVGRLPRAFMFTGQTVWVANFSDNTVQAIDQAAGNVAAFIKVGRTPRGLAFDGARLWIINSADGQVQSIDPDT
ncbi:MAG: hypothetical protein ACRDH2_03175, partial [Anaerolineales bacterium]